MDNATSSQRGFWASFAFQPGVSIGNVLALLLISFFFGGAAFFTPFVQPYILSVQVGMPADLQGRTVTGLQVLQCVIAMALVGFTGALSDRRGRRPVVTFGIFVISLSIAAMAFVSTLLELAATRLIFSVGIAALTSSYWAAAADYPRNESRGRLIGALILCQQAGGFVLVSLLAGHLPNWLHQTYSVIPLTAGKILFAAMTVIAMSTVAISRFGLKGGLPAPLTEDREIQMPQSLLEKLRITFRLALDDRQVLFVLILSFVTQTGVGALSVFVTLWVMVSAGHNGTDSTLAMRAAGTVLSLGLPAGVMASLVCGFIFDHFNRINVLILALGIAGVADVMTFFITDATQPGMIAIYIPLLISETMVVIGSQAALGQAAPTTSRGAVVGVFGLIGFIGQLTINIVGGILFDKVGHWAPFVLVGLLNLALVAIGVVIQSGRSLAFAQRHCR